MEKKSTLYCMNLKSTTGTKGVFSACRESFYFLTNKGQGTPCCMNVKSTTSAIGVFSLFYLKILQYLSIFDSTGNNFFLSLSDKNRFRI